MIEHHILSVFYTIGNFRLQIRFQNIVCPEKIFQIQMPCAALSHPFWFEHHPLALSIHNIQHCFPIVKTVRKGFVKRIVYILDIKRGNLPTVFFYRTFHGICPCSHIVHIRTGNLQSSNCPACGKIQSLLGKGLSRVGNALRLSCTNQRYFYHRLIFAVRFDIFFRIVCHCNFLCHHYLKLRFLIQDCLYCTLD